VAYKLGVNYVVYAMTHGPQAAAASPRLLTGFSGDPEKFVKISLAKLSFLV